MTRISSFFLGGVWAAGLVLLIGCSAQDATPDAAAVARAAAIVPAQAALAAQYERSCRTCHSQVEAKAPLAGFGPHWTPRLAQGMPTLVSHVREGYLGMPARGYCNDCSDADYEALIRFMATSHQ